MEELSPGAALCIYRIAQEALGNVAKHAQAKQAESSTDPVRQIAFASWCRMMVSVLIPTEAEKPEGWG